MTIKTTLERLWSSFYNGGQSDTKRPGVWQIKIDNVAIPGLWKDYATFRKVIEDKVKRGEIEPDAQITVTKVDGRPTLYVPPKKGDPDESQPTPLELLATIWTNGRGIKRRKGRKPKPFFRQRRYRAAFAAVRYREKGYG